MGTIEVNDPHAAMLASMRATFGAPGDYGHGTAKGVALIALYGFLATRSGQPEPNAFATDDTTLRDGVTWGCAMSVAHMLRRGEATLAFEWWQACGLTIDELVKLGVDDYDLDPIRRAFATDAVEGAA